MKLPMLGKNTTCRRRSGEHGKKKTVNASINTGGSPRHLAAILLAVLLFPMLGKAADTTLAHLPKMTAAEAAETVLAEGVIVRITDTTPHDVRVGDGETAGGIRIGDGIGWEEGDVLTQDLYTGGNNIYLGEGFEIKTLGGWSALSGPATVDAANDKLYISVHGTVLAEFFSEVGSLHLDISNDATHIILTTQIGEAQPTIQHTTNLLAGTWAETPIDSVVTNAATYDFYVNPTNFTGYCYFRAVVASGSGSSADFTATLKQNGEPVAIASDVATEFSNVWNFASNRVGSLVYTTNTVGGSYITNGILYLGTNVPAGGGLSGTNQFYYYSATANGTNYVVKQWYDATNHVFKFTETAQ